MQLHFLIGCLFPFSLWLVNKIPGAVSLAVQQEHLVHFQALIQVVPL